MDRDDELHEGIQTKRVFSFLGELFVSQPRKPKHDGNCLQLGHHNQSCQKIPVLFAGSDSRNAQSPPPLLGRSVFQYVTRINYGSEELGYELVRQPKRTLGRRICI